MNNWRYYETWGSEFRWRINNEKTNQFFLSEYESDAKWLEEVLNKNDEIGMILTINNTNNYGYTNRNGNAGRKYSEGAKEAFYTR